MRVTATELITWIMLMSLWVREENKSHIECEREEVYFAYNNESPCSTDLCELDAIRSNITWKCEEKKPNKKPNGARLHHTTVSR